MSGALRFLWIAAVVVAAACSEDGGTGPENRTVASVVITAPAQQIMEGEEITLAARALDANGLQLSGRTVTWTSTDESVATVTAAGVVKGITQGGATIRATSEGKTGSVDILVTQIPVASITLDFESATLAEGDARQTVATLKSATGQVLTGYGIQWSSSDPEVAYVDALGKITAIRVGVATVSAKVHGKTASANVLVNANYDYDLVYAAWNGTAGVPPEAWRVNFTQPGSMPARLFPNKPVYEAMPSPDATRIVFSAYYQGRPQIYVANMDGSDAVRLTDGPAWNDQPAWSPDGARIAFRKWNLDDANGQSDIWVMDANGANAHNLTADMGQTNQLSPSWSPLIGGAYRIAFSGMTNQPDGEAHLFTMKDDGSDRQQVTFGVVFDDQPAWSPDGATIAFERYNDAIQGDIFAIDATGGNERRLTPSMLAFGQFGPAWSPDGKLLAFTSKHADGNTYQVYTVWADGSKLAQRTFDATTKSRPEFVKRVE